MIKINKSLERMNSKRDEWRDTLNNPYMMTLIVVRIMSQRYLYDSIPVTDPRR